MSPPPDDPAAAPRAARRSFRDVIRYFLALRTWGFGGPIATVGYMQRDLVAGRRAWRGPRDRGRRSGPGDAVGSTSSRSRSAIMTRTLSDERQ